MALPYLWSPGVSGATASVPDSAALSLTGDFDVRGYIWRDFTTPAAINSIVSKFNSAVAGYRFYLNAANGLPVLAWVEGGTTNRTATASTLPPVAAQTGFWLRATLDVDTGAGTQRAVKFWYSLDPPSTTSPVWTQLGTTITAAGTTSVTDGPEALGIGSDASGSSAFFLGRIYRVQIRNNILDDGTGIVFDEDFTTETPYATSVTEDSANAATVTINGFALITAGMAAAPPVSVASTTNATSYATASWNPKPNRLYKVDVGYGVTGTALAPTLSGNGITWGASVLDVIAGTADGMSTFLALSGAAPSSGALTADFGAVTQNGCIIQVTEIDGADITGTALAAIVQSATDAQGSIASPRTLALGSATLTSSRCFSAWFIGLNSGLTPRANWTELADAGHATPNKRLETQWRADASEQTAGVSGWAGNTLLRATVLEIRAMPVVVAGSQATTTTVANAGTPAAVVAGGQASTSTTANSGIPVVVRPGSQSTESDVAAAGVPLVVVAGSMAVSGSAAFAGAVAAVVAGSQTSESDAGRAGLPLAVAAGTVASTVDAGRSGSPTAIVAGSMGVETDAGRSGTSAGLVAGSRADATDTGSPGAPRAIVIGAAGIESDAGQSGVAAIPVAGSLAIEVDVGGVGSPVAVVAGSTGNESDAAAAGSGVTRVAGQQAAEPDVGSAGSLSMVAVGGRATESDAGRAGGPRVVVVGVLAVSVETGRPGVLAVRLVGVLAVETDSGHAGLVVVAGQIVIDAAFGVEVAGVGFGVDVDGRPSFSTETSGVRFGTEVTP